MKGIFWKWIDHISCELDECTVTVRGNGDVRFYPSESDAAEYYPVTADVKELWKLVCEGGEDTTVTFVLKEPFDVLGGLFFKRNTELSWEFTASVSHRVTDYFYSLLDGSEYTPDVDESEAEERHKIVVFKI